LEHTFIIHACIPRLRAYWLFSITQCCSFKNMILTYSFVDFSWISVWLWKLCKPRFHKCYYTNVVVEIYKTVFIYVSLFESSIVVFNTHNMQDNTQSQTPELHHKQSFYIAANNIYKCFANLPWSFVVQFEIASKLFPSNWCTFAPKWNLNKDHSRNILKQWCTNCLNTKLYLKNHLQNVESKN